ncbi:MAG: holo-[acyl-carrier-protein] synthase [candidate division Zixibacteria bacterium]|nr:holo-[acyl-carrier-protein] synthase [candidate division Zixibacteria bacterium]
MITAIGIDLIEIDRIKDVIDKWGDRFLHRVFTPWEINYCMEKTFPEYSFAARFAVKEAVMKAIGSGLAHGLRWTSIEVVNNAEGKPFVRLGERARDLVGSGKILISMTHTHNYAAAQAVLVDE